MSIFLLKLSSSNWPAVEQTLLRQKLKVKALDVSQISDIQNNELLIIPGVGNIKYLSKQIENEFGIARFKKKILENNIKVIGICLGFQFLCQSSDEDKNANCLNLLNYKIESIYHPVRPSVGWKKVKISAEHAPKDLISEIKNNFFYFTHSFGIKLYIKIPESNAIYYYKSFNNEKIIGAVINKNIAGCQFHPEKSGEKGSRLLCSTIKFLLN